MAECKFYIGQRVVCIDTSLPKAWGVFTAAEIKTCMPTLGAVYTVHDIELTEPPVGLRFVEIVNPVRRFKRPRTGWIFEEELWYDARRFKALDGDMEVFRRILREARPERELQTPSCPDDNANDLRERRRAGVNRAKR